MVSPAAGASAAPAAPASSSGRKQKQKQAVQLETGNSNNNDDGARVEAPTSRLEDGLQHEDMRVDENDGGGGGRGELHRDVGDDAVGYHRREEEEEGADAEEEEYEDEDDDENDDDTSDDSRLKALSMSDDVESDENADLEMGSDMPDDDGAKDEAMVAFIRRHATYMPEVSTFHDNIGTGKVPCMAFQNNKWRTIMWALFHEHRDVLHFSLQHQSVGRGGQRATGQRVRMGMTNFRRCLRALGVHARAAPRESVSR